MKPPRTSFGPILLLAASAVLACFPAFAERLPFRAPRVPILMNASALPETDPARIRRLILDNLTPPVLWRAAMQRLRALQPRALFEIGPGRILSGLARANRVWGRNPDVEGQQPARRGPGRAGDAGYMDASLREAHGALEALLANHDTLNAIQRGASLLVDVFRRGGRVYSCGNGGSMCDAMHFAEELTGRYRHDRAALPATAISDAGHLTCVANDLGYEQVFSRYIEAHGRKGDCLVALSTSGTSKNVVRAVDVARNKGVDVILLSGRENAALRALSSVFICTPAGLFADRVQELHIKVLHIFIELIEREMFPVNYGEEPPSSTARASGA